MKVMNMKVINMEVINKKVINMKVLIPLSSHNLMTSWHDDLKTRVVQARNGIVKRG